MAKIVFDSRADVTFTSGKGSIEQWKLDFVPRVGEIVSFGSEASRHIVKMVQHYPAANRVVCYVKPIEMHTRKALKKYE